MTISVAAATVNVRRHTLRAIDDVIIARFARCRIRSDMALRFLPLPSERISVFCQPVAQSGPERGRVASAQYDPDEGDPYA
jgi:hypothetical protein